MTKPSLRGLHLHVDAPSGAAGDMLLGALIDLGVPVDVVGDALDIVGAGRRRLTAQRINKGGIAAIDVKVDASGTMFDPHSHDGAAAPGRRYKRAPSEPSSPGSSSGRFVAIKFRAETHERHVTVDELGDKTEEVHEHADNGHSHGNAKHAHVHYSELRSRIHGARLPEGARLLALDIFDRLARAEARLHGTSVADVVFHEVGAVDSVVDVVGTAAALDWLSPASVSCAAIAMGHGTVRCAHGIVPVPAPAALEVLREAGGIMVDGGAERELCTPTGAAILAACVTAWKPAPAGRPVAVGWGAGDADLDDRANVVRVVALAPAAGGVDTVWQIDANIDDMSPELCGPAADAVFAAGALDVWWTPITMKKGRPALTLSALADDARREQVIAAILRETTTIGVRYAALQRTVLERQTIEVETRFGRIPVKVALDGDAVRNAAPEYEACAAAARAHNVPLKLVYAAALAAYERDER
jgi:uncharacterized protein (TIGR00299 family) protein